MRNILLFTDLALISNSFRPNRESIQWRSFRPKWWGGKGEQKVNVYSIFFLFREPTLHCPTSYYHNRKWHLHTFHHPTEGMWKTENFLFSSNQDTVRVHFPYLNMAGQDMSGSSPIYTYIHPPTHKRIQTQRKYLYLHISCEDTEPHTARTTKSETQ